MENSTLKILVLDDDPFILKVFARFLSTLGYEAVTTCDNGLSALCWVEENLSAGSLILLDLNMPDMDGIEFVRKLVERRYSGGLILVSGEQEGVLHMAQNLVQAHQIAVLGHVRKPVTIDALSAMINNWNPKEIERRVEKSYTAAELRDAIANGELTTYCQPKVSLKSGDVAGVEMLVRWRHPIDGIVFPGQFIHVAEQNGLIDMLTEFVLTDSLKWAKTWAQLGLHLHVSVNVSMENLGAISFANFVTESTTAAGVDPRNLVLEVTESRLIQDQRAPLEVLTRLKLKHFRLSIDDFGTGHSSLAQLRNITFDELKIDHSFVHGAYSDSTVRAMYDASLRLGKQLGMEVVAEGVEDLSDWELVRKSGCDLAQGYFIARPLPTTDFANWIETWRLRCPQLTAIQKRR